MPTEATDVLVIGAGPVGLTTACELKRHGVNVRLIDKKPGPNTKPNAAIVHVRTLEILAAMGAVDGFLREGYAFPGFHAHAYGKKLGYLDVSGIDSPYPMPRTLGQQITERLLRDHFQSLGGTVEHPVEAIGLEQTKQEVRVRLKHIADNDREEIATARWVVGCEGAGSMSRQALGIEFTGERYSGKEFLQIDAKVRWTYPHGYGYQFITDDCILMLFAYDTKGHYRIICARNDRDAENTEPPTLAEMQEHVQQIADPTAELYDPLWFNRFRTGHRLAASFREGRVFIAGDAGHVHIPIGGQGMNYGMHDAFNLGWKLAAVAKGEARPELLDTYMTERHPTDESLIKGTDLGFHAMVEPHAAKKLLLQFIAPTLIQLGPLQKKIRNTLAEMNVAYPASALTEDRGGSTGPVPGDRAPDAVVVRMPERETTTLFNVMHGTRWTLLLFAGTNPAAGDVEELEKLSAPLATAYGTRVAIHLVLCGTPPVPVHENWAAGILMDREHTVHEKYGVTSAPCLYLIRPDWHIAFRGDLDNVRFLEEYLTRVFV